jgi:LysM repeat protein
VIENMEVLMARFDRRVSRPLIVVLVLAVGLGAISIFHQWNKSAVVVRASTDAAPTTAPSAPLVAVIDHPPAPFREIATTKPADVVLPVHVDPIAQLAADVHPAAPQIDTIASTEPSIASLASAKAEVDAGRLLEARAELNAALQAGSLSESDAAAAKAMISGINQTVVFGKQLFADDPYGGTYVVKHGDSLAKIAVAHDCTWELLGRINGIDAKHLRAGATIKVVQGPFFGVVDKKKFTIDLYLGGLPGEKSSMLVTTYQVGLGRDDSTPVGTWMIEPQRKLKHPTYYSPRGEGVIPADDPKNPLGGYWIGLTGTEGQAVGKMSYGIHGTIDPDSIGKQSSMGCIRLRHDDIEMVYEMMVEGKSMVVVKE